MTKKNIRTILHPSLGTTFVIMVFTGILMFFHICPGGIRNLHEWISILFLVLCAIHLYLNWNVFMAHLKNGPFMISVIGVCLLSVILLFSAGDKRHDRSDYTYSRHLERR